MNLNEEVEVLKGVPIFAKMEPAKLKLLAFTGERMTFGAGQEVCHQGERNDQGERIAADAQDLQGHVL